MKRFYHFMHQQLRSVRFYILLGLVILILPLNILFLDSARRSSDSLISQAEYNLNNVISIYAQEIEDRIERTSSYLNNLLSENTYFQTIKHQKNDAEYTLCKFLLAQELIDQSLQENKGDYYFLYSPLLSDFLAVKRTELSSAFHEPLQAYLTEHISEIYISEWQLAVINNDMVLIHACYNNGMYLGSVIKLDSYLSKIQDTIEYPSISVDFITELSEKESQSNILSIEDSISGSDAYLQVTISRQDALKGLSFFQKNAFLLSCLYLLIIPILYATLNLLLLHPLAAIRNALLKIREGNQDYRFSACQPFYYAIEFREITSAFNQMMDSIHTLTIENYEQQLARQQVELDNLQLTIRPHFLQNTFGLLFTLCQMGENKKLGEFILYLSDYFRYVYRSVHQLTSFSSEMMIIRGYIEIAKVQHPNSFEIQYDLPSVYDNVMIPPLLVHNFIENIMSHALKHGQKLHILLRLELLEKDAVFTISDDGIGMPPAVADAINQGRSIQSGSTIHVGLYNSWQRLDKIYLHSASMLITSCEGKGTTVTIHIPQKEQTNEIADCK